LLSIRIEAVYGSGADQQDTPCVAENFDIGLNAPHRGLHLQG